MKRLLWAVLLIALVLGGLGISPRVSAQDGGSSGYTYTVVGGKDEPQTYEDQEINGFSLTHFTYQSDYPFGLEFRVVITPPEDVTVTSVILFYTFTTGKTGRVRAEPGDQPNEWVAIPYDSGGLPPWHEMDVTWGIRAGDVSADSAPVHAVYYDPTREWFRAESDDIIVFWFGMPEELGHYVIDAMAGNQEKYQAGFGIRLPYRPVSVIFPPGAIWNEYRGDTSVDDTNFGFTGTIIPEAGGTIQRVRTLEPAAIRADCIWNPEKPDQEFQMKQAASTTVHEVAHLYQEEVGVGGPSWWVEGQATFFETFEEYPVHDRLRKLAELRSGDFPTFQGQGPDAGGALTTDEDGCTHLIYDMGASFMKWIAEAHGGMDTYRAIVDQMALGHPLPDALETAVGVPMVDLENEWRAFLGVGPIPAEVFDPGLALGDPVEPFFAPDEQVILPAAPFQQPIYSAPTIQSAATAACFANSAVTIKRVGSDGSLNWYEVDCMGLTGWMNQGQLVAQ